MDSTLFENNYFVALVTFILGVVGTILTKWILNKQALLTYSVNHHKIGVTVKDKAFGNVEVKWDGNDVPNLFLSTVELTNYSTRDLENLELRAFSSNTILLTERTEILGTTRDLEWTTSYKKNMDVGTNGEYNKAQTDLLSRQRDYAIPVLNRNQTIRITYLTSAPEATSPSVWLDVVHKGVKIKYRVPKIQIYGVDQPRAALVGTIIGSIATYAMVMLLNTTWLIALMAFFVGLVAQMPGVAAIKFWRWLKGIFSE